MKDERICSHSRHGMYLKDMCGGSSSFNMYIVGPCRMGGRGRTNLPRVAVWRRYPRWWLVRLQLEIGDRNPGLFFLLLSGDGPWICQAKISVVLVQSPVDQNPISASQKFRLVVAV